MKSLITLIAVLLSTLLAGAQAYIPFPSSNTLWTIRLGKGEAEPDYYCYALKAADTVIGATTYHQLYKAADSQLNAAVYCGGLREDGARRVYYYNPATASETMIYDFSMAVGDTLRVQGGGATVSTIDSIYLGGQYHRRINFRTYSGSPWPFGAWIEGMGNNSVGGLLGSPMALPTCDCAARTLCFRQGTEWVYHNAGYTSVDCFGPALGIGDPSAAPAATLYPNPVTGISHIRLADGRSFCQLKVYSAGGAIISTYDVTNRKDIALDGTTLPAGIYYFRLWSGDGSSTAGKFVVQ